MTLLPGCVVWQPGAGRVRLGAAVTVQVEGWSPRGSQSMRRAYTWESGAVPWAWVLVE